MILCVACNPAIDVTYRVSRLERGSSHRVGEVRTRAGGKAVNVARVLSQLGKPVRLLAILGGATGTSLADELRAEGLPLVVAEVAADTRRTTTVVDDDGTATPLNERGVITEDEWVAFLATYDAAVAEASVVVLSGSAPEGMPISGYADLVRRARAAGALVILDASGQQLREGLQAEPTVVKPNADELRELEPAAELLDSAHLVQAAHPGTTVVASMGPDGMVAVTGSGTWLARPEGALQGNPTGAGDAAVAALSAALHDAGEVAQVDWAAALASAVGMSGSAVLQPVAGVVDLAQAQRLAAATTVTQLTQPA